MPRPTKSVNSPVPAPAPAPAVHVTSSLGQSIKDGIGMGLGSAFAHRMVSSLFGPPKVETIVTDGTAKKEPYEQCMKYNSNDHETCKTYLTGNQGSSQ